MRNIFHRIKRSIRFFFQRMFRGFDDSETWNMDLTFYKWLLPRIRRFIKVTNGYPITYKNMSQWKKEVNKRTKQLERIIARADDWESAIKVEKDMYEFNQWFAKNLKNLWW